MWGTFMGLDNILIGYITTKFDTLMDMQIEMDLEPSPSKKTDIAIDITKKFDDMIVNLKYWGDDDNSKLTSQQQEERQKMLKEFGFPEKL